MLNKSQLETFPCDAPRLSMYCATGHMCFGSGSMKGCRVTMEDFYTNILSLPEDPETSFFAVYDGHGGDEVAKFAELHLPYFIVRRPEYKRNIKKAIQRAFLDIDMEMYSKYIDSEQVMGSTALVILLKKRKLYCGNAGDSLAVISKKGQAELLSVDHKPDNEIELKRIYQAGGKVICHRINSRLAVSRALGDFIFKQNPTKKPEEQMVTAYPDVVTRDINDDYEFVVLASDGIWEVMDYQEVVDFCRIRIAKGRYPIEICEELMNHCAIITTEDSERFEYGADNMVVILVCFLGGKSFENYSRTIALSYAGVPDKLFDTNIH